MTPIKTMLEVAPVRVALAQRAHDGDAAALNDLLAELRPLLVQTARLIVGSGSTSAEDAAQDALLDISRDIGRLRDPTAVKTWALRIVTRRALRVARRERLFRPRSGGAIEETYVSGEAAVAGRTVALKEAFDRLPPRLRATAVLRLQAGLTEEETAQVLGCSVGTVKSNLHDARLRLSKALTEAGYTPTVQSQEGTAHDR